MEPITALAIAAVAAYAWHTSRKEDEEDVVINDEVVEEEEGSGGKTATFVPTVTPDATEEGEEDLDFDFDPGPGSPSTSGYSPNPPPNPYGSTGYNTELYPDPKSVREGLQSLGYDIAHTFNTPPPKSAVQAFQRDYNEATDRGYRDAKGILVDDGIPGKKTLRALERAQYGADGADLLDLTRGYAWKEEFGL